MDDSIADSIARSQDVGDEDIDNQQEYSTPASDLPEPESLAEWESLPHRPPKSPPVVKGFVGAAIRTFKHIPPCVWVVNLHTEEITVAVSKYRPNRLVSGVEVNASATGAGLNVTTTTFLSPASKKTLTARNQDGEGHIATFPLWTRQEGFGVITIYKGSDQTLYIENDRVPLGATAYFMNKPNLRIVEYKGGGESLS